VKKTILATACRRQARKIKEMPPGSEMGKGTDSNLRTHEGEYFKKELGWMVGNEVSLSNTRGEVETRCDRKNKAGLFREKVQNRSHWEVLWDQIPSPRELSYSESAALRSNGILWATGWEKKGDPEGGSCRAAGAGERLCSPGFYKKTRNLCGLTDQSRKT